MSTSPEKARGRAPARALLLLLAIIAAGLAVLSSGASAASKALVPRSQSYEDPAGEIPDIRTVTVSNDSSGMLTFKVAIPGSATFTQDMEIYLWIDSDNNTATGDPDGTEYGIDYWNDVTAPSANVDLIKYDASAGYQLVTPTPGSITASYAGGVATFTVSAADLGITSGINLSVYAYSGITYDPEGAFNYDMASRDVAPDSDVWNYGLVRILPLSSARLTGAFSVIGKNLRNKWTFKPNCVKGACSVKVRIMGLATVKLSRTGRTYKGGVVAKTRCSNSRSVRTSLRIRLKITKAAWSGSIWRATAWTGTMKLHAGSCKGRAKNVTLSLRASRK